MMTANTVDASTRARVAGLSPAAQRLLAAAGQALSRRQLDAAEHSLIGVLALAPENAEVNRLMGIICQMRGNLAKACDFLRQARTTCPHDALVQTNLGSALCESGAFDAGLSCLRRACELAPGMATSWYNLGLALKKHICTEQAIEPLRRAVVLDPAHIPARLTLADTQASLGDISAAVNNYREILGRQPAHPKAWFELANLKTVPLSKDDVVKLRHVLKRPDTKAEARIPIGFALAKALEDQDDYPAAFEAFREANALKRHRVNWDAATERASIDAIMRAFDTLMPAPLDPTLGRDVIFIVSLPRSGSTLVEQILASHSHVTGANEIKDLPQTIEDESRRRGRTFPQWVGSATAVDWARLGQNYLVRTKRWRRERPRFTDKNLINWRLVGAILTMLPGARVVNCRRDALETCLACYRQLFSDGAHFSYDLSDMARCWQDYDRLSRYWQQRFPRRVLDYPYESLLTDTEPRIRRLLEFCNLEFDPACLAFHQTDRTVLSTASAAQVRQPLRRDTARSARYGRALDQLRLWLRDPLVDKRA